MIVDEKEKSLILSRLRDKGCRITKQRQNLINIILENECSSCKEIYYKAAATDDRLGIATVYRMINLLEEIGVIDRKNMYTVNPVAGHQAAEREPAGAGEVFTVVLDDGTVHHLSAQKWKSIICAGLKAKGYLDEQHILSVSVRSVHKK